MPYKINRGKSIHFIRHLCESCREEFATCHAERIVFGIDRDPSLRGAAADAVLECSAYCSNPKKEE